MTEEYNELMCPWCGLIFPTKEQRAIHLRTVERKRAKERVEGHVVCDQSPDSAQNPSRGDKQEVEYNQELKEYLASPREGVLRGGSAKATSTKGGKSSEVNPHSGLSQNVRDSREPAPQDKREDPYDEMTITEQVQHNDEQEEMDRLYFGKGKEAEKETQK